MIIIIDEASAKLASFYYHDEIFKPQWKCVLHTHKILFANNAFFTPEGRVTDDLPLRGEIFESLKHYAINNVPRKVTNILEVMKLAAYIEDFPPEANIKPA